MQTIKTGYEVKIENMVKYFREDGSENVKSNESKYLGYNPTNIDLKHKLFDEMVENIDEYTYFITVDAEYRRLNNQDTIEFYNHKEGLWMLDDMDYYDISVLGDIEYLLTITK